MCITQTHNVNHLCKALHYVFVFSSVSSGVYGTGDQNYAKFLILFRNVVTDVFRFIFREGSADRLPGESLWDFYERNGIQKNKLSKRMTNPQKQKVDADPNGSTFDITLLYYCIRNGYHQLSNQKAVNLFL